MKKLLLGAAAAIMVFGASCSDKHAATMADVATDSLSIVYGQMEGANAAYRSSGYTAEQKRIYMNAFSRTLAECDSAAAIAGAQMAISLLNSLDEAQQAGFGILNRELVIANFREYFMQDSVNFDVLSKTRDAFREQLMNARERMSQGIAREGRAYVDSVKAADPAVATTASGLSYKVEAAGDESVKPESTSTVRVKYTGYHTNGTVFDTSGDNTVDFNLQQVIPGFTEGLQLIGKGGKVRLYIPGNLAYGPQGNPQGGIEPNETLIFDIDLVDVNPAAAQ